MTANSSPGDQETVITFDHGLIGMPQLRRMVLGDQAEAAPFLWLASLDDSAISFLVINPRLIVPNYQAQVPAEVRLALGLGADEEPLVLAISLIATEWAASTVNLYAPLVICSTTMRGAQVALTDSSYSVDHPLVTSNE